VEYGQYEGRRTPEIHAERPDWQLFRDGCPGGESSDQVGARADRALDRVRSVQGDVLLFSSGHFLRVFAARWLGLEAGAGRFFMLSTASLVHWVMNITGTSRSSNRGTTLYLRRPGQATDVLARVARRGIAPTQQPKQSLSPS